jgi:DNA-binding transcriptional LysR family regulator
VRRWPRVAFNGRMLNGIGVLVAVVEAGTFVRAAEALGLTQSGVSRAIARLEVEVGVRLLQRSARAVTLTEEGRGFYQKVTPLLAGIEDAASEAADASATPKGTLRVAIDALGARVLMGPRIAEFLARFPELSLELIVRDQPGDLIADGLDAAIRFGEPPPSTLILRKLLETRVLTCAARPYLARRGRPTHPRQLAEHECILYRDATTGRAYEWEFHQGKKRVAVKVSGRLMVNDSATQLAACIAGHGITQVLEVEWKTLDQVGQRGLEQLLPEWAEERFPLYVYYPSRHLPPAKVRALVDFVVAALA